MILILRTHWYMRGREWIEGEAENGLKERQREAAAQGERERERAKKKI